MRSTYYKPNLGWKPNLSKNWEKMKFFKGLQFLRNPNVLSLLEDKFWIENGHKKYFNHGSFNGYTWKFITGNI